MITFDLKPRFFSLGTSLSALCLFLMLALPLNLLAQEEDVDYGSDGWPAIPGIDDGKFAIYSQNTFIYVMGAAVTSFLVAELAFRDSTLNFYQGRLGIWGTDAGTVVSQGFGIEKRSSHWFAIALELNVQEWSGEANKGMGLGLNTIYRWYAFGKKRVSPYLEFGAGIFQGFRPFPQDGSGFTFHLTTRIGAEIKMRNKNQLRFDYGHLHQSNNDLFDRNPGVVGNGLSISWSWFWKKTRL